IRRLGPSSSAFLLLAGVRGRTPGLAHHNVFFSSNYRTEFREVFDQGRPPSEPTIYLGCSAVDDPSQAPAGAENWTVLVNVPASDPDRWPLTPAAYRDVVLERLARFGLDVTGRLQFTETMTPRDVRDRYDAWDGAIYSTPQHGRLSPWRRPGNRGPVPGLYLVGGSTHPGGGLPLVAKSAQIVADLVNREQRS
ncbi:MAG TPA: FAD-dependent oxidoreductase, partial [Mycobacteriales bacterium]|nr:FAD-dependent oxidoreductase [Mycobacteriales bacterium]